MPHNDPTLPQLTAAFKAIPVLRTVTRDIFDLIPPSSDDGLRRLDSKSACVLLQSNHSITSDTLSASVTFEHTGAYTPSNQLVRYRHLEHSYCNTRDHVTIRTVRVVPMDGARSRTTACLPTELLMKILEATDSCAWQRDLLSFAQVCRRWSQCSMRLLFARLESPERYNHCPSFPTPSLDPCAFGKALGETPVLGLGIQHLDLDQHNGSTTCSTMHINEKKTPPGFIQALIAILRATKNLQLLHLSLGYSSHADALFSSLPKLDDLHTLSITQTKCRLGIFWGKYWIYSISTIQLSRCMARWSALTSLTVEHLVATMGRLFLRPPACALTYLCIRASYISAKDLLYLTASSAHTLAHVTLDSVWYISYDGLCVFLDAISRNVVSLTIHDAEAPEFPPRRKERHALDVVVDRMRRLQALDISGDVASGLMLRRRSEMFLRRGGSDSGVPVVRLSFEDVPGISECEEPEDEWAGWEVVEVSSC